MATGENALVALTQEAKRVVLKIILKYVGFELSCDIRRLKICAHLYVQIVFSE